MTSPIRILRKIVAPTGRHRARPDGAIVTQAFRFCEPCGVETAAVLHASDAFTCTEGHLTVPGGAQ